MKYIEEKKSKLRANGRSFKEVGEGLLIYWRKGVPININCRAKIDNHAVKCKHWAYLAAKNNLKGYFSSEQEVLQRQDLKDMVRNRYFDKLLNRSSSYNIFALENLGNTLCQLVKPANKFPEGSQLSRVLLSENHAMTFTIRHKKYGVYAIKFYDPNTTNIPMRIVCPNLESIKSLKIQHLFPKQSIQRYWPSFQSGLLLCADECDHGSVYIGEKATLDGVLYLALTHGLSEYIEKIPQDILLEQLKIKSGIHQVPGFFSALRSGNVKVVNMCLDAFIAAYKRQKLTKDDLVYYLSAKRESDGLPGFAVTLFNGGTEAVRAFGQTLLKVDLSNKEKFELLRAKDKNAKSALYWVLRKGDTKTVETYIEVVLNSGLGENEIFQLFAAKHVSGKSGFGETLLNGHLDTARAFGKVLRRPNLNNRQIIGLLTARGQKGIPVLYGLLQSDDIKGIETYIDIVLNSGLSNSEIAEILTAKNSVGLSCVATALQDGHVKGVKALMNIVASKLSFISSVKMSNLTLQKKADYYLNALNSIKVHSANKTPSPLLKQSIFPRQQQPFPAPTPRFEMSVERGCDGPFR